MARGALARAVPGAARGGDRAALHRRVLQNQGRRHLPLRGLRRPAVRLGHEVRVGHAAGRASTDAAAGGGRAHRGHAATAWSAPRCAAPLRLAPGPRLRRRPEPDRPALLHELAAPSSSRATRAERRRPAAADARARGAPAPRASGRRRARRALGAAARPAADPHRRRGELRERLAGPPPDGPGDPDAALDRLLADVVPYVQHTQHPRYFARVPSPGNPVGLLADLLAAGLNVFVASWAGGSGPTMLELEVLDWIRGWCGLPAGTEGISSAAARSAASPRWARPAPSSAPASAYVSDQTHSSIVRALGILGLTRVGHPRPAVRRRLPAARRDRRACRRRRSRRRLRAFVRDRHRGHDEHRLGRPAGRPRRPGRRRGPVVPRRRRVRRARAPHARRPRRSGRHRPRRLDRARPAQVALPAATRSAARARPPPRAARARVRARRRRVPARRRGRRGELPRPRPAAHARDARDEALARPPDVRPRRRPRRRSPAASRSPSAPSGGSRRPTASRSSRPRSSGS